jgi:putative ATPase
MQQPLAFRLRPEKLDDIIGQKHILGPNGFIRKCKEKQTLYSMILYGPPGVGKTTIAICLANELNIRYKMLNATTMNKKDMETAIEEARFFDHLVVIIDEIHRINKDKQDFFLPHVESGLITLIGATTANPYHYINPAIRSRCHLVEVKPLSNDDIVEALKKALVHEKGLNNEYTCDEEVLYYIAKMSSGDVRFALNNLEIAALCSENKNITLDVLENNLKIPKYVIDKDEDGHYDAVSALQKSIRGSDVNASLYYLARLIEAGDLESIERRLLATAYEDIGLANPNACARTVQALDAARKLGFPEAYLPLSVAVVDLALSPKSKSCCNALGEAINLVREHSFDVPPYLRLTPVNLSEEDSYPYDRPDLWEHIQYLPNPIAKRKFFKAWHNGNYERALNENYQRLQKIYRTNNLAELKKRKY